MGDHSITIMALGHDGEPPAYVKRRAEAEPMLSLLERFHGIMPEFRINQRPINPLIYRFQTKAIHDG